MKHFLLLAGVIASLAIGTPSYGQYIFMDLNGDSTCTSADVLTSSTTAVDVWLNTNHNKNGSTATCFAAASTPLDMFSYDILVHSTGSGGVVYNNFTNTVTGYTIFSPFTAAGANMGVGYQAPFGTVNPGGLFKLGTISVTVTGNPTLSFLTQPPIIWPLNASTFTGFGSPCPGTVFLNTVALGPDFSDNCGTSGTTPSESTTWGKIKQLYR